MTEFSLLGKTCLMNTDSGNTFSYSVLMSVQNKVIFSLYCIQCCVLIALLFTVYNTHVHAFFIVSCIVQKWKPLLWETSDVICAHRGIFHCKCVIVINLHEKDRHGPLIMQTDKLSVSLWINTRSVITTSKMNSVLLVRDTLCVFLSVNMQFLRKQKNKSHMKF